MSRCHPLSLFRPPDPVEYVAAFLLKHKDRYRDT